MATTYKPKPVPGQAKIRRSFKLDRRLNFYRDMAKFIEAGITPFAAMERMRDVAKPRKRMQWMVRLMNAVLKNMKDGAYLSQALSPFIPAEEAALLNAGEASSELQDGFRVLAELLEKRRQVNSNLRSMLLPSLAMGLTLIGLMVFILNTVLKEAANLIAPEAMSKLVLAPLYFAFGNAVLTSLPFAVPAAIVASILIARSLPSWKPAGFRRWLDTHVPPYTMYARIQSSFFLLTAAAMMEAGQPFKQAVDDILRHASPWPKAHMKRMLKRLARGNSEADAMQVGMLPVDVEDRLAVYKLIEDYKFIMRVTARDSMEILLQRVTVLGLAIKVFVMFLLATFIIFTIFSIGEIAIEMQSAINSVPRP